MFSRPPQTLNHHTIKEFLASDLAQLCVLESPSKERLTIGVSRPIQKQYGGKPHFAQSLLVAVDNRVLVFGSLNNSSLFSGKGELKVKVDSSPSAYEKLKDPIHFEIKFKFRPSQPGTISLTHEGIIQFPGDMRIISKSDGLVAKPQTDINVTSLTSKPKPVSTVIDSIDVGMAQLKGQEIRSHGHIKTSWKDTIVLGWIHVDGMLPALKTKIDSLISKFPHPRRVNIFSENVFDSEIERLETIIPILGSKQSENDDYGYHLKDHLLRNNDCSQVQVFPVDTNEEADGKLEQDVYKVAGPMGNHLWQLYSKALAKSDRRASYDAFVTQRKSFDVAHRTWIEDRDALVRRQVSLLAPDEHEGWINIFLVGALHLNTAQHLPGAHAAICVMPLDLAPHFTATQTSKFDSAYLRSSFSTLPERALLQYVIKRDKSFADCLNSLNLGHSATAICKEILPEVLSGILSDSQCKAYANKIINRPSFANIREVSSKIFSSAPLKLDLTNGKTLILSLANALEKLKIEVK